eukprot:420605-Pyramimonas_sp.AAC.1
MQEAWRNAKCRATCNAKARLTHLAFARSPSAWNRSNQALHVSGVTGVPAPTPTSIQRQSNATWSGQDVLPALLLAVCW